MPFTYVIFISGYMKVFEEYGFAAYKADDKKEETAEDAKEDKTEETDTAEEAK